jgi:hypothetical protein
MKLLGWLRDYPRFLENIYQSFERKFYRFAKVIDKVGYERVDRLIRVPEKISKKLLFDCRMCGQCTLHTTGMTCPMTCPKTLRNGPCGGVSVDGCCEVKPEMMCIWVEAYGRDLKMSEDKQRFLYIQAPLNHSIKYESAWINKLCCEDDQMPEGWKIEAEKDRK